jgi:hypothetical protein
MAFREAPGEARGCLTVESERLWDSLNIPLIPAKAGIHHFAQMLACAGMRGSFGAAPTRSASAASHMLAAIDVNFGAVDV